MQAFYGLSGLWILILPHDMDGFFGALLADAVAGVFCNSL
jgi:hypothetical protein